MSSAVRTRYDAGDSYHSDSYAGDDFRMYEFKVRRCMRCCSHDWTDCPFAHPGEKARRRDPCCFHYSGNACPEFRRGVCRRGDACQFAHGVFECWLHPARYRTQPCRDGRSCRRKVCFFAHTPDQLRVLPSLGSSSPSSSTLTSSPSAAKSNTARSLICSCAFSPYKSTSTQLESSPTSTLMGLSYFSPPLSPPLSPGCSPLVCCTSGYHGVLNYKSLFAKLVTSLDTVDLSASASASPSASSSGTTEAFLLSPTGSASKDYYEEKEMNDQGDNSSFSNDNGCPDLDWVNELVM
ncbi:zinc finger CCCH domain-containing protein 2-like [Aristolochia californica]|uniref:zinc finger CCCH domain-containing protein 2-like n=1 Tax=Aristolochia californica TaxID=171875 RepID=UPI0035D91C8A